MAKKIDLGSATPEQFLKEIESVGGQRAFSKKYGIPRTTVQRMIERAKRDRFRTRTVKDARDVSITGVQRFILTSAQDSTKVHEGFLQQLEAYCDFLSTHGPCEIMVAGYTYNKSLFEDHAKRSPLWPSRLHPYMVWERIRFGDKIDFCAEMNTRPTAENPLSGFETYTRHRWGIFPHAKVQMKSIPTMRDDPAKIIMTTGSVTLPNYVPLRAGIKAQFHHVIGAVLVEIDEEGTFFCRHLIAEEDGSFHDLDRRVSGGVVTTGVEIAAVNWGDIHVAQIDPEVARISFGFYPVPDPRKGLRSWSTESERENILDSLRPSYQFFHDVSDFRARNHHGLRDPHLQFRLHCHGVETVESELREVAEFVHYTKRDFCETVIVNSNHDAALQRWLREADYRYDPPNARFFLWCQLAIYAAIEENQEDFSIFETALKNMGFDLDDVRFLDVDESFKVFDIEKGMHGHLGGNGAQGTLHSFARMGSKATIGHSHSCGIFDGIYQAGTSSKLFLDYNTGLSSWSNSHVITYSNGKRAIITINNSKWKL